jgi:hypothetical protein
MVAPSRPHLHFVPVEFVKAPQQPFDPSTRAPLNPCLQATRHNVPTRPRRQCNRDRTQRTLSSPYSPLPSLTLSERTPVVADTLGLKPRDTTLSTSTQRRAARRHIARSHATMTPTLGPRTPPAFPSALHPSTRPYQRSSNKLKATLPTVDALDAVTLAGIRLSMTHTTRGHLP